MPVFSLNDMMSGPLEADQEVSKPIRLKNPALGGRGTLSVRFDEVPEQSQGEMVEPELAPEPARAEPKTPEVFLERFKAVQNPDHTWTIYDVDIFCELKRTFTINGEPRTYHFDKDWLEHAVKKALIRYQDGYLPTLHQGHNNDETTEAEVVGFFLPKDVRLGTYQGEQVWKIFSDWLVPNESYQKIKKMKFPYRSLEINDYDSGEISSCALLQSKPPWVKNSPLLVQETTIDKAGPSAFVQKWKQAGVLLFSEFPCELEFDEVGSVAVNRDWSAFNKRKLAFNAIPVATTEVVPNTSVEVQSPSPKVKEALEKKLALVLTQGGMGIPRAEMPQVKTLDLLGFVRMLKGKGIKVTWEMIPVRKIRPTQKELIANKLLTMLKEHRANVESDPGKKIGVLSADQYLMDGHHRWGMLSIDNPQNMMRCVKVNVPIEELLREAKAYVPTPDAPEKVHFGGAGSGAKVGREGTQKGGRPAGQKDMAPRKRRSLEELVSAAQSGDVKALRIRRVQMILGLAEGKLSGPMKSAKLTPQVEQKINQTMTQAVSTEASPTERSLLRRLLSAIVKGTYEYGPKFAQTIGTLLKQSGKIALYLIKNPLIWFRFPLALFTGDIPIIIHPSEAIRQYDDLVNKRSPDDGMNIVDHRELERPTLSKEQIDRIYEERKAAAAIKKGGQLLQIPGGWPNKLANALGLKKDARILYDLKKDPEDEKEEEKMSAKQEHYINATLGKGQSHGPGREQAILSHRKGYFQEPYVRPFTRMVREANAARRRSIQEETALKFGMVVSNKATIAGIHSKPVYFGESILQLCKIYKSPNDNEETKRRLEVLKNLCQSRAELVAKLESAPVNQRAMLGEDLQDLEAEVYATVKKIQDWRGWRNKTGRVIREIKKAIHDAMELVAKLESDQELARIRIRRTDYPQDKQEFVNEENAIQRKKAVAIRRIEKLTNRLHLLESNDPEKQKLAVDMTTGLYAELVSRKLTFADSFEQKVLGWFGAIDLDRKEAELSAALLEFDELDRELKEAQPAQLPSLYQKVAATLKRLDKIFAEEESLEKLIRRVGLQKHIVVKDPETAERLKAEFQKVGIFRKMKSVLVLQVRQWIKRTFITTNLDELLQDIGGMFMGTVRAGGNMAKGLLNGIKKSWLNTKAVWEGGLLNRYKLAVGRTVLPEVKVENPPAHFDDSGKRGRKGVLEILGTLNNDVQATFLARRAELERLYQSLSEQITSAELKEIKAGGPVPMAKLKIVRRDYAKVLNHIQEIDTLLSTYQKAIVRAENEGFKTTAYKQKQLKASIRSLSKGSPERLKLEKDYADLKEEERAWYSKLWILGKNIVSVVWSFVKFLGGQGIQTIAALPAIAALNWVNPAIFTTFTNQQKVLQDSAVSGFHSLVATLKGLFHFSETAMTKLSFQAKHGYPYSLKFQGGAELRILRDLREAHREWHRQDHIKEDSPKKGSFEEPDITPNRKRKGIYVITPLKKMIGFYRTNEKILAANKKIYYEGKGAHTAEERMEAYRKMIEAQERVGVIKAKLRVIVDHMTAIGESLPSIQSRLKEPSYDLQKLLFKEKPKQKFGGPGSGCAPDSDTPSCQVADKEEEDSVQEKLPESGKEPVMPMPGAENAPAVSEREKRLLQALKKAKAGTDTDIEEDEDDDEDLGDWGDYAPKPKGPPRKLTPEEVEKKDTLTSMRRDLIGHANRTGREFEEFKQDFIAKNRWKINGRDEEEVATELAKRLESDEQFQSWVSELQTVKESMRQNKELLKGLGVSGTDLSKMDALVETDLEGDDSDSIFKMLLNSLLEDMEYSFRFASPARRKLKFITENHGPVLKFASRNEAIDFVSSKLSSQDPTLRQATQQVLTNRDKTTVSRWYVVLFKKYGPVFVKRWLLLILGILGLTLSTSIGILGLVNKGVSYAKHQLAPIINEKMPIGGPELTPILDELQDAGYLEKASPHLEKFKDYTPRTVAIREYLKEKGYSHHKLDEEIDAYMDWKETKKGLGFAQSKQIPLHFDELKPLAHAIDNYVEVRRDAKDIQKSGRDRDLFEMTKDLLQKVGTEIKDRLMKLKQNGIPLERVKANLVKLVKNPKAVGLFFAEPMTFAQSKQKFGGKGSGCKPGSKNPNCQNVGQGKPDVGKESVSPKVAKQPMRSSNQVKREFNGAFDNLRKLHQSGGTTQKQLDSALSNVLKLGKEAGLSAKELRGIREGDRVEFDVKPEKTKGKSIQSSKTIKSPKASLKMKLDKVPELKDAIPSLKSHLSDYSEAFSVLESYEGWREGRYDYPLDGLDELPTIMIPGVLAKWKREMNTARGHLSNSIDRFRSSNLGENRFTDEEIGALLNHVGRGLNPDESEGLKHLVTGIKQGRGIDFIRAFSEPQSNPLHFAYRPSHGAVAHRAITRNRKSKRPVRQHYDASSNITRLQQLQAQFNKVIEAIVANNTDFKTSQEEKIARNKKLKPLADRYLVEGNMIRREMGYQPLDGRKYIGQAMEGHNVFSGDIQIDFCSTCMEEKTGPKQKFGGPGSGCAPDSDTPSCKEANSKADDGSQTLRDSAGVKKKKDRYDPYTGKPLFKPKPKLAKAPEISPNKPRFDPYSGKELSPDERASAEDMNQYDPNSGNALQGDQLDKTLLDVPSAAKHLTNTIQQGRPSTGELTPKRRLDIVTLASKIRGKDLEKEQGEIIRPIDENDLSDDNVERAMDILEATQKGLDPTSPNYANEKNNANEAKKMLKGPLGTMNIFRRAAQKGADQKGFARKVLTEAKSFYGDVAKKMIKPLAKIGTDVMETTLRTIVGGAEGALSGNPMNIMRWGPLSENYTGGIGKYIIGGKDSNSEYVKAAGKDPDFARRVMQNVRRRFGLRPGLDFAENNETLGEQFKATLERIKGIEKQIQAGDKDPKLVNALAAQKEHWAKLFTYVLTSSAKDALKERMEKEMAALDQPKMKMQEATELSDKDLFIIMNRAKKLLAGQLDVQTSVRPFKAQGRPGVSLGLYHKGNRTPSGKLLAVGFLTLAPSGNVTVELSDESLSAEKIKTLVRQIVDSYHGPEDPTPDPKWVKSRPETVRNLTEKEKSTAVNALVRAMASRLTSEFGNELKVLPSLANKAVVLRLKNGKPFGLIRIASAGSDMEHGDTTLTLEENVKHTSLAAKVYRAFMEARLFILGKRAKLGFSEDKLKFDHPKSLVKRLNKRDERLDAYVTKIMGLIDGIPKEIMNLVGKGQPFVNKELKRLGISEAVVERQLGGRLDKADDLFDHAEERGISNRELTIALLKKGMSHHLLNSFTNSDFDFSENEADNLHFGWTDKFKKGAKIGLLAGVVGLGAMAGLHKENVNRSLDEDSQNRNSYSRLRQALPPVTPIMKQLMLKHKLPSIVGKKPTDAEWEKMKRAYGFISMSNTPKVEGFDRQELVRELMSWLEYYQHDSGLENPLNEVQHIAPGSFQESSKQKFGGPGSGPKKGNAPRKAKIGEKSFAPGTAGSIGYGIYTRKADATGNRRHSDTFLNEPKSEVRRNTRMLHKDNEDLFGKQNNPRNDLITRRQGLKNLRRIRNRFEEPDLDFDAPPTPENALYRVPHAEGVKLPEKKYLITKRTMDVSNGDLAKLIRKVAPHLNSEAVKKAVQEMRSEMNRDRRVEQYLGLFFSAMLGAVIPPVGIATAVFQMARDIADKYRDNRRIAGEKEGWQFSQKRNPNSLQFGVLDVVRSAVSPKFRNNKAIEKIRTEIKNASIERNRLHELANGLKETITALERVRTRLEDMRAKKIPFDLVFRKVVTDRNVNEMIASVRSSIKEERNKLNKALDEREAFDNYTFELDDRIANLQRKGTLMQKGMKDVQHQINELLHREGLAEAQLKSLLRNIDILNAKVKGDKTVQYAQALPSLQKELSHLEKQLSETNEQMENGPDKSAQLMEAKDRMMELNKQVSVLHQKWARLKEDRSTLIVQKEKSRLGNTSPLIPQIKQLSSELAAVSAKLDQVSQTRESLANSLTKLRSEKAPSVKHDKTALRRGLMAQIQQVRNRIDLAQEQMPTFKKMYGHLIEQQQQKKKLEQAILESVNYRQTLEEQINQRSNFSAPRPHSLKFAQKFGGLGSGPQKGGVKKMKTQTTRKQTIQ